MAVTGSEVLYHNIIILKFQLLVWVIDGIIAVSLAEGGAQWLNGEDQGSRWWEQHGKDGRVRQPIEVPEVVNGEAAGRARVGANLKLGSE